MATTKTKTAKAVVRPGSKAERGAGRAQAASKGDAAAVEAVVRALSPKARAGATRLRKLVRSLVPQATEAIRYGICTFQLDHGLVGFAGTDEHTAFYAMSGTVLSRFPKEVAPWAQGKSTLHFPNAKPLPISLVKKIVKARLEENAALASRRGAGAASKSATASKSGSTAKPAKTAVAAKASRSGKAAAGRARATSGLAAKGSRAEGAATQGGAPALRVGQLTPPEIVETTARPTAIIPIVVARSEIQKVMGPGLQELLSTVAAQGITPAGPWFTHHLRITPETFDFEISVPVSTPVVPSGRVRPSTWPAMKVARTEYHGGFEGLGAAWEAFTGWVRAQGLTPADDLWEVYLAGPEVSPDPKRWRTQLNRPLVG